MSTAGPVAKLTCMTELLVMAARSRTDQAASGISARLASPREVDLKASDSPPPLSDHPYCSDNSADVAAVCFRSYSYHPSSRDSWVDKSCIGLY